MKVTMIVGEPCVGKSTIMRRFMASCGTWSFIQTKYVPHHTLNCGNLAVLGRYDEPHQFPGTDRMSMAAQPKVLDWLKTVYSPVVFEGDRLGNASMLDALRSYDIELVVITTPNALLTERRKRERGQSDTFLRSRQTKIKNLIAYASAHNVPTVKFSHDGSDATELICAYLMLNRTGVFGGITL